MTGLSGLGEAVELAAEDRSCCGFGVEGVGLAVVSVRAPGGRAYLGDVEAGFS